MEPHFTENKIKCRLLDTLLRQYPKSIICVEVPFLSGKRWVDVLVITSRGDLIAYEVKSHLDTLRRMRGQVEDYVKTFSRVNMIVAPRHLDSAKRQLPSRVGLAFFEQREGRFVYKRRAGAKERLSKANLAKFLWKRDICGAKGDHDKSVTELRAQLVARNTCRAIQRMATSALRARYGGRFRTFVKEKGQSTHLEDLEYLTREYGSLL